MVAGSGSGSTGATTATLSTLAASTCGRDSLPAAARTIAVRRGSTASTVARPSGQVRTTTQSPVPGRRVASAAAAASSPPPMVTRCAPAAPMAVQTPRSTRTTRAGCWSARACPAYAVRNAVSHPRVDRSNVMRLLGSFGTTVCGAGTGQKRISRRLRSGIRRLAFLE